MKNRRFMRRIPVAVKLWITTGVLAIPLIGLGLFYVQSLTSTLLFTQKEQQGEALYRPLDQVIRSVAHLKGSASSTLENPAALSARIDSEVQLLSEVDTREGNSATHAQVAALQEKWNALKQLRADHPSAETLFQAYENVLDASFTLKGQILADWQIILDPELASYNLLDVYTGKFPDADRFLGDLRTTVANASTPIAAPQIARALALSALIRDRLSGAADEIKQAAGVASDRTELAQRVHALSPTRLTSLTRYLDELESTLSSAHPDTAALKQKAQDAIPLTEALSNLQEQTRDAADTALALRHARQLQHAVWALSGAGVALLLAVALTVTTSRRVGGAIRRLLKVSERISEGRYDSAIDASGEDDVSRLFAGIDSMQKRLKIQIEAERRVATENARIKRALDSVSTSVLVTDAAQRIIYVNPAMQTALTSAEADIRQTLPDFSAATLIGTCADRLHLHPGPLLANQTVRGERTLGARTFAQTLNPILTEEGDPAGTVLEWSERTQEVRAEKALADLLSKVLAGKLSHRMDTQGCTGFFATLGNNVNQLTDSLASLIASVQQAAHDVQRGAEEISSGNADLSQRTEEQSSSLEETAASMEEMTSTVRHTADNAMQAKTLASAAREQAEQGGAVTSRAVSAMSEITTASRKIGEIIAVIDDIAFQTNLLSLNAAVEAARAGAEGRGFAVVAGEVRNLSRRSATAAKEIKALIGDSLQKVETGSALVTQSGQALEQIVLAVKKVSDIVAEIAAASQEQSIGIDQVNKAVTQMDQMTQQNAALVEEAAAASESMAEQARALAQMMARYELQETPASVVATISPSHARTSRVGS